MYRRIRNISTFIRPLLLLFYYYYFFLGKSNKGANNNSSIATSLTHRQRFQ